MLTSPPRGFNSLYLDTGNDFRLFFVVSLRGPPPPPSPPPFSEQLLKIEMNFSTLESRLIRSLYAFEIKRKRESSDLL